MAKRKNPYKYRIKKEAYATMLSVIKPMYGGAILAIEEGAICKVTDVMSTENIFDKSAHQNNPTVFGIKIHESKIESEAFILPDLLDELPTDEWIFEELE